jgi:hypothetical protein
MTVLLVEYQAGKWGLTVSAGSCIHFYISFIILYIFKQTCEGERFVNCPRTGRTNIHCKNHKKLRLFIKERAEQFMNIQKQKEVTNRNDNYNWTPISECQSADKGLLSRQHYRAILLCNKIVIYGCVNEINFGLQRNDWKKRESVVWGRSEVRSTVTREQSR